MSRLFTAVLLGAALVLSACSPSEDPSPIAEKPPTPFTGKVDDRLVGVWQTENGASTYTLAKSGDYQLKAKIKTPGGSMDTSSAGSWSVDDEFFLMRDGLGNVAKYKMSLSGDRLRLSTIGSMKRDLTLVKK